MVERVFEKLIHYGKSKSYHNSQPGTLSIKKLEKLLLKAAARDKSFHDHLSGILHQQVRFQNFIDANNTCGGITKEGLGLSSGFKVFYYPGLVSWCIAI